MCHLILALPVIALPLLWLLPPGLGIPLYAAAALIAGVTYALSARALRRARLNGPQTLIHATGTVRAGAGARLSIWVGSELWSAEPTEGSPAIGDRVEVVGHRGLTLLVRACPQWRAASVSAPEAPAR